VSAALPKIRTRLITDSDIEAVASLLSKGFKRRSRQYWLRALDRLAKHPTPTGFPKYGYLMEGDCAPVGVVLLIFSRVQRDGTFKVRCNVSSWYVEPAYRSFATFLVLHALSNKSVTYLNISPAPHVQRIIEAQGYLQYTRGQFVAFPALFRAPNCSEGTVLGVHASPDVPFEPFEQDLLLKHSEYGCISFWFRTIDRAYPFVFLPRIVKGCIPCAQLIYCRTVEDFVRFSKAIGWFLALRGRFPIIVDSSGPIAGLRGRYFEGAAPKYFKGSEPPHLGDLAYTEAAMFGI
jgi:hypothetical protein